ncbi:hypothetical protein [Aquamicrobium terrae]
METVEELKHEIQEALKELHACEACLRRGETSPEHESILKTIARLERILHDRSESHLR